MKIPEFVLMLLILDVFALLFYLINIRKDKEFWGEYTKKYGPRFGPFFVSDVLALVICGALNKSMVLPFTFSENFIGEFLFWAYVILLMVLLAPIVYALLLFYGSLNFDHKEE